MIKIPTVAYVYGNRFVILLFISTYIPPDYTETLGNYKLYDTFAFEST